MRSASTRTVLVGERPTPGEGFDSRRVDEAQRVTRFMEEEGERLGVRTGRFEAGVNRLDTLVGERGP